MQLAGRVKHKCVDWAHARNTNGVVFFFFTVGPQMVLNTYLSRANLRYLEP